MGAGEPLAVVGRSDGGPALLVALVGGGDADEGEEDPSADVWSGTYHERGADLRPGSAVDSADPAGLDADLVVLSACDTGAADRQGSEAVSGLGRAFFYSGARALLVTMWPMVQTP